MLNRMSCKVLFDMKSPKLTFDTTPSMLCVEMSMFYLVTFVEIRLTAISIFYKYYTIHSYHTASAQALYRGQ